ncbi:MAG: sugar phosphate isomerase/epimerase [Planctomycetota bacterium]|nr:sugar phosphate isomerase/epimerase [Planctomycetota bacterium]
MALACSTSAFKASHEDALAEIAALGFRHADLIAIPGFGQLIPAELARDFEAQARRAEAALAKHDLTAVAVNAAFGHLRLRAPELLAQRRAEVEAVAKLMRRLNVGVASFYPGFKAPELPWADVLRDSAATMREMLAIGRDYGVAFAIELHFNTPFENVEQCARLFEVLPELPVAYDPSHFAMQGIDLKDTKPFLDRAAHVHLRDAAPRKMQVPTGSGTVDFDWILNTLAARKYPGHYSIEYLAGLEGGVHESIKRLRARISPRGDTLPRGG